MSLRKLAPTDQAGLRLHLRFGALQPGDAQQCRWMSS